MSREIAKALRVLCPGYIEDLITAIGLTELQSQLVRLRYIKQKSVTEVALLCHISPETYHRIHKAILLKIKSLIVFLKVVDKDNPILQFFS